MTPTEGAPQHGPRKNERTVAVLAGSSPKERYSIHHGYIDALWAVGAQPVIVPAGSGADVDLVLELVTACRALVVSGGDDIDPLLYGSARGVGEKETDPDRDVIEIAAVRAAAAAGVPVLGICRGIQLMVVADGGTLVADLPAAGFAGHWEEERQYEPVHEISADPGSLAAAALGGASSVNSIHHQAVSSVGETLRASAWSPDGVVEAIEGSGALGIQWHPERLAGRNPDHLAPFRWVIA
jgi:putative glutamine amidotransferase